MINRNRRSFIDYLIALIVILTLNFALPRALPGDPLTTIYGDAVVEMSPELEENLTERYGFNRSIFEQYFIYLGNLARGDLGYSFQHNAPVIEILLDVLPWTLLLVGLSLILSTLFGAIVGIETSWRSGSQLDKLTLIFMMFLNGIPAFFIGYILLILLSFQFQLFPLSGAVSPYADLSGFSYVLDIIKHLFLPALTLFLVQLPRDYLLMRNSMLGIVKKPFVITAKSKGVKDRKVQYKHAARGALLPVLTRFGMSIGLLFTGVLFVEIVFAYPGIGHLFYQALQNHDYPLVQGSLLVISILVILANLMTDILAEKVDPRLKEGEADG